MKTLKRGVAIALAVLTISTPVYAASHSWVVTSSTYYDKPIIYCSHKKQSYTATQTMYECSKCSKVTSSWKVPSCSSCTAILDYKGKDNTSCN
jgi:hypothetical protein